MAPRKYEIEAIATTYAQQLEIDKALESLARQGIYVHSNRERNTETGASLTTVPGLIDLFGATREEK